MRFHPQLKSHLDLSCKTFHLNHRFLRLLQSGMSIDALKKDSQFYCERLKALDGPMNLNQLRIFYESARQLSFTRAAEYLHVSQPAVSSQVRQLEEILRIKLFCKVGTKIFLTEPGKVLLNYAQKIFDLESEAENTLNEIRNLKKGSLHIGTTKTYARYFMPHYISSFHTLYPEVRVYLNEGSSMEMIQSLLHMKSDLAIVATAPFHGFLNSMAFGKEEVLLVASHRHPLAKMRSVTVEKLAKIPLIMREEGSGTRQVVQDMFKARNLSPTILYEASNLEFIKELLISGEAASFIVRPAVEKELAQGILKEIRISGIDLTMDANILYIDDKTLSRAARAFLGVLTKEQGLAGPKELQH